MPAPATAYSPLGDCFLLESNDCSFWLLENGGCWMLERDINNTPYTAVAKNKTAYQEA